MVRVLGLSGGFTMLGGELFLMCLYFDLDDLVTNKKNCGLYVYIIVVP